MKGDEMYEVLVYGEGDGPPTTHVVPADTEDDARIMAFILDGGWNSNGCMDVESAKSLKALAYTYTDEPRKL